ncbi:MAG: septal ring lytic transglycosylase RlpA family protein [Bacteroidales bacterium]|nr:septal ring lytic transglycosylase RlpA family protein [Bacteroidales bacterium]
MRTVLLLIFVIGLKLNAQEFSQTGKASYYANKFEGRLTANGEVFSNDNLTAAHKSLPFGTRVVVFNLTNNKQITLTINDRGPFIKGRIIDVSQLAAKQLGFFNQGITQVRIELAHKKLKQEELLKPLTRKTLIIMPPYAVRLAEASRSLHPEN